MKSTTRFTKNMRGIECLNCKQPISDNDNFCSNCGQVNDELPLSIKQFISEFFSGFFSFDTRFFKTFIPLLFKPGKVSKDYIVGKRRRYVNPFQLYLHVTILFFLIIGLFSALDEYKISDTTIDKNPENAILTTIDSLKNNTELNEVIANIPISQATDSILSEIGSHEVIQIINKELKPKNIEEIRIKIDSIFNATNFISLMKNSEFSDDERDSIYMEYFSFNHKFNTQEGVIFEKKGSNELQNAPDLQGEIKNYTIKKLASNNITYTIPNNTISISENDIMSAFFGKTLFKKISDFIEYDKEHKNATALEALDSLGYKNTRWNVFYFKKAQDINKFGEDENFRDSYLDEMLSKISIALFFLLPVFTLFLSLLYIRHKRNYTEHLVFVFNVQTVFFLLLILFTVIGRIVGTPGIPFFIIIFLFYLYKSLRNFYNQGRIKTLIKFMLLNFAYFFLSVIGMIIIGFITFAL
ncbi:MAG: hypothetical protein COA67_12485 [Lutibacter sp.]|nr:MAG: hypothetical protein COA67_12485 [Lutibacter sp.]